MESLNYNQKQILLPNSVKKYGFFLSTISILTVVSFKIIETSRFDVDVISFKTLSKLAIIIGLSLIIFSKDKQEDELTDLLRLKSMAWAFIYYIIYTSFFSLSDLIFHGTSQLNATNTLISMQLIYLMRYYLSKLSR